MNLDTKNQQSIVSYSDFTGGLNTTTVPEMIAPNQMADCINMEFDRTTGALQTCCGTATVFQCPDDITIDKLWYDEINNMFLFTDANTKSIYASRLVDMAGTHPYDREKVGSLSGEMPPTAVMWENGLLIASGGRLQYWDGLELVNIAINVVDDMNNSGSWEKIGTKLAKKEWKTKNKYEVGNRVMYDGKFYCCLEEHVSGEFDETKWQVLNSRVFAAETDYDKWDYVKHGKYFYLCTQKHTSIADAPAVCNGVFIKGGRVWIWHDYRLECSGVGDERCWWDDSNDDSTAKWIDVGYKEGEKEKSYIAGACALSSDIVIIKNDGKVYRLAGDFPDWALKEIARNLTLLNPQCYCAIQDGVFIVGREGMWLLHTTVDYGDVQPTNVANSIMGLLGTLSIEKTYIKFLPSLNQIWVAGFKNRFIVFDLNFKAFIQREFNSEVNDICLYKEYFMLTRKHRVTELMQGIFEDEKYSEDESKMRWKIVAKSHTSFWDFLLKRMRMTYVPLLDKFKEATLITAEGRIRIDIPESKKKADPIFGSPTLIYGWEAPIFPINTQFITKWMVYRNRIFGIELKGEGSAVMINRIDSAIAEV